MRRIRHRPSRRVLFVPSDEFVAQQDFSAFVNEEGHMTGCLPRSEPMGTHPWLPVWSAIEDCPILDESEWNAQASKRGYETWARDVDQNGYPACTLAATANALQFNLAINGREHLDLDWLKAWKALSGGRGGVALDDALTYIMGTGMPIVGSTKTLVLLEAWDCPDVNAAVSALQRGADGLLFGHDSHAECGLTLVDSDELWSIDTRNSWNRSWGDRGFHLVPLSTLSRGIPTYGCFAFREVELQDSDVFGPEVMPDAK